MTQHTPGPWIAAAHFGAEWIGWPVVSNNGRSICDIKYIRHSARNAEEKAFDEESQANARLIAAAPELLKALQECVTLMHADNPADGWKEAFDFARAAIAKATA